jgi:hypothetical protein
MVVGKPTTRPTTFFPLPFFPYSCKIEAMNNYKELENLCASFDRGFDTIESLVDKWGHSKKPIKKVLNEIQRSSPDEIATDSEMVNSYLYLLAEFFQDAKAIKQLKTGHEAELSKEGLEVLSFWEKNPGFWCYFSVKEELSEDFHRIVDHMTGEEHILYSHGITIMQAWEDAENSRYLCMMLPNGECLQPVGAIKPYRLPVSDFLFYCSLFKPEEGLKAILGKHFIQFIQLDSIAAKPTIRHKVYDMGFGWQPFTLAEFDITSLPGRWVCLALGSQQKFYIEKLDKSMDDLPNRTLLETAAPAMAGCLVRDIITKEMGIVTNTEVAYPFYAAILKRSYPTVQLPEKPSVFISAVLQSFLPKMDLPLPWKKFLPMIGYRKERELDDSIDYRKGNWLERERGDEYDFVDEDDDLEEMNEYVSFNVSPKDKAFELSGWKKPEDVNRGYLYRDLYTSELFTCKNEKKAYRQFVQLGGKDFAAEVRKDGLFDMIEALFSETFDEDLTYPVMNTFFWILYHKGKDWVPARSYALEILKWIPLYVLQEYPIPEEFKEVFSHFTKKLLCSRGICSLKALPTPDEVLQGAYAIKATDAFYSLLKVKKP